MKECQPIGPLMPAAQLVKAVSGRMWCVPGSALGTAQDAWTASATLALCTAQQRSDPLSHHATHK